MRIRVLSQYLQLAVRNIDAPRALSRLHRSPPLCIPAVLSTALVRATRDAISASVISRISQQLPTSLLETLLKAIANTGGAKDVLHIRKLALAHENAKQVASISRNWFVRTYIETPIKAMCITPTHPLIDTLASATTKSVHPTKCTIAFRTRLSHPCHRLYIATHDTLDDLPLAYVEFVFQSRPPHRRQHLFRRPTTTTNPTILLIFSSLLALQPVAAAAPLLHTIIAKYPSHRYQTLSPIPKLRHWLQFNRPTLLPTSPSHHSRLRAATLTYLNRTDPDTGMPLCRVARFHLANGARLQNVLLRADLSPKRVVESFGVMAVYEYLPSHRPTSSNHIIH